MTRGLRVWGGLVFDKGQQHRELVAAETKRQAALMLVVSPYEFRQSWCETGNAAELALACEVGVWVSSGDPSGPRDWRRIR